MIGAINGPAVGVGATMLLPMDYRIASQDARFGFVFTRLGIVPEAASSWFLPRLVGIARALDWTLAGRMVSAGEALQAGLVSAVHAPASLLDAAYAIARPFVKDTAPVSVTLTRQLLWQGLAVDHPMEMHRIDSRLLMMRGSSADAKEGVGSFLEKRAPRSRIEYPPTFQISALGEARAASHRPRLALHALAACASPDFTHSCRGFAS